MRTGHSDRAVSLLFIAVLLIHPGCTRCDESVAERAMERAVEQVSDVGEVSIETGKEMGPAGLPVYLLYPGATVTGRYSASADDGSDVVYVFGCDDDQEAIVDWFRSSLTGEGWDKQMRLETADAVMMSFAAPGDSASAQVVIGSEDSRSAITVAYSVAE